MLRLLLLATTLALLAGCATPSYRYYGERHYVDEGYPVEETRYVAGGGYGYAADQLYWADYPAYYSLFWSFNRLYVDPYYYPHFYYGVTWFPRNYYSVSYRSWYGPSWYGRPWYGYLSYSPYRLSWVDHYYDWYPWYAYNPRHHNYYAPRYGGIRNESERLSRYSDWRNSTVSAGYGYAPRGSWGAAARSQNAVEARRESLRGADYGGRTGPREDPRVSGFSRGTGTPRLGGAERGTRGETPRYAAPAAGTRADPGVSGFQQPRQSTPTRVPAPRAEPSLSREGVPYPARSTPPVRQVESAPRYRETAPRTVSPSRSDSYGSAPRSEGYSVPAPRYSAPRESSPRYAAPAPRETPRYESPRDETPSRSEPRYSAPAPRYEAPPRQEPRYSAPAPSYSAPREQPRYSAPEPRSEPRYETPARESRNEERAEREGSRRSRSDER
jgi:hypothetical protein